MGRRMGYRIKFFSRTAGQNEDGEIVDTIKNVVCECWANISKTTVKDFKVGGTTYVGDLSQNGQKPLETYKDVKIFIIRYHRNLLFDNSMYIEFDGMEYKITRIEKDYVGRKTILVEGVGIS